jgi:aryl-alcohol dehydrogenase-like predicted oxidoreductase
MQYRSLGSTGLRVSAIGLGTADFGDSVTGREGVRLVRHALDRGVSLFDTANAYSGGRSEEILGEGIRGRRDDAILSTKFGGAVGPGPEDRGGGRRHVLEQIEASLRRLRTDRIDLYQIHHPDPATPIEETLDALDELVRSGKVLHVGCSNFHPPELAEALAASDRRGLARFVTEQAPYHLLDRRIETELLPLARREGVALLPYTPLCQGILSGRYRPGEPPSDSRCARSEAWRARYAAIPDASHRIVARLKDIARDAGTTLPRLAVAWVLRHPDLAATLVGARTPERLDDLLPALEIPIDEGTSRRIDGVHPPGGFAWF